MAFVLCGLDVLSLMPASSHASSSTNLAMRGFRFRNRVRITSKVGRMRLVMCKRAESIAIFYNVTTIPTILTSLTTTSLCSSSSHVATVTTTVATSTRSLAPAPLSAVAALVVCAVVHEFQHEL
eukprot:6035105-Pleurochrysis_carterae.AAC.2